MFNRLSSPWSDDTATDAVDWDRDPQSRFVVLWIVMLIPLLAIGVRVAHLQLCLKESFASGFSFTTETLEEIQVSDGRILAADGSLIAHDIERFDIAVYYPVIQDPPDDTWIAAKAKLRLGKADRKNKKKLAEEKQNVVSENEGLWVKLAALTNRPLNEVIETRRQQQVRLERIKESVHRRFGERQSESFTIAAREVATFQSALTASWQKLGNDPNATSELASSGSSLIAAWLRFRKELEESPEKIRGPRLIKEEQDYLTVITDVSVDVKREIESHPERYPYTRVLVQTRRTYPHGELASHLIGVRKPMTEEDHEERRKAYPDGDPQDYRIGDSYGRSGLERTYDMHLKGIRGQQIIVKNRRGEIVETRVVRDPRPGHDLVLTLDIEVQRRAEKLIEEALNKDPLAGPLDLEMNQATRLSPTCPQGGAIFAYDIHTGSVIAAASRPGFDLNLLVTPDSTEWEDVVSDPRSPFLSRTTHMALPPGSVFKVISAVASIETGKMSPDEVMHCRGYLDRPDQPHRCLIFRHNHVGHNDVTMADALCRSCNVYFYTAARRMGPQPIADWARKFGIGQRTGIDLPSESSGNLPSPDAVPAPGQRRKPWKPGDTLGMAIGQSELTVTPVQMARVMAAIANDGYLVTPRLAANSGPTSMGDGDSIQGAFPQIESRQINGLHRDTLDRVREGLVMVVNDPRGTAYKYVRMKEVTIAGKTGTAETNGAIDHAWFAGYVPAEQPRIAFCVVLQNGGGGGKAAGPVAKEFVKALIDSKIISSTKAIPLTTSRGSQDN